MTRSPTVLGIDPGLASVGLAVVRDRDVLLARTVRTDPGLEPEHRIRLIAEDVAFVRDEIIFEKGHDLQLVSVESQWRAQVGQLVQGRSTVSALHVEAAFGAVIGVAVALQVPVVFPSPAQVKAAVGCGRGADKAQIQRAVRAVCRNVPKRLSQHAADAVACAVAGLRMVTGVGEVARVVNDG